MTSEEMERTMEFILGQNAQTSIALSKLTLDVTALTADVVALKESQQQTNERIDRLTERIDRLAEQGDRNMQLLEGLLLLNAESAYRDKRLDKRMDDLAEAQARTEERMNKLAEAQTRTEVQAAETNARLDRLAKLIEQYVTTQSRNGHP